MATSSPYGSSLRTVVAFVLLSSMINPTAGHGYVNSPRSRNIVAYLDGVFWTGNPLPNTQKKENDPMSLNRGGLCGVSPGGVHYTQPPNYSGGLMPANVQATFTEGEEVEFEVILTAHHMGHFEYKACPLEKHGDNPTQQCFDDHPLMFVKDISHNLPADVNHPERLYVPPPSWMDTSGLPSGRVMRHKFKLPDGLNGDLVLIQWHYVTGNSCVDVGYRDYFGPGGPNPFPLSSLEDCIQPFDMCGEGMPEQFWNCIEVAITPSPGAYPSPIPAAGPASLGCNGVPVPAPYPQPTTPSMPVPITSPSKRPTTAPTTSPSKRPTTAPTTSPTSAPTMDSTMSTVRCGLNFDEANSKCGAACGGSKGLCTPPEGCFSGLSVDSCPVPSASPSMAPSISPSASPSMTPSISPTVSPTESTIPTASPTAGFIIDTKYRCGTSEVHAREMCGSECNRNTDCPSGQMCYATHKNYCSDPNFTPPGYVESAAAVSTTNHRCGKSEIDARSFCKTPCFDITDCIEPGETCYPIHANYCGSPTNTRRTLRRHV